MFVVEARLNTAASFMVWFLLLRSYALAAKVGGALTLELRLLLAFLESGRVRRGQPAGSSAVVILQISLVTQIRRLSDEE